MKKSLLVLVITLSLAACGQAKQPAQDTYAADVIAAVDGAASEPTHAGNEIEDLSTPVDVAADGADEPYRDEGQPDSDQMFYRNHFNVMRLPNFNGQDMITIQKITDGRMIVNSIVVNRGRCALLSNPDPRAMEYSSKMTVYLWGCNAEDVLEVQVNTDQGYATYGF